MSLEGERCDFCEKGTLKAKRVREIFRKNQDIVLIDDVPAFVCNHCGERYYLADVNRKLRDIAENQEKIKNRISVPLADYEDAI
ncbi:MAG: YgiT-type zinc finger protein [bacterium]